MIIRMRIRDPILMAVFLMMQIKMLMVRLMQTPLQKRAREIRLMLPGMMRMLRNLILLTVQSLSLNVPCSEM